VLSVSRGIGPDCRRSNGALTDPTQMSVVRASTTAPKNDISHWGSGCHDFFPKKRDRMIPDDEFFAGQKDGKPQ
jgi:hypothetical protein